MLFLTLDLYSLVRAQKPVALANVIHTYTDVGGFEWWGLTYMYGQIEYPEDEE